MAAKPLRSIESYRDNLTIGSSGGLGCRLIQQNFRMLNLNESRSVDDVGIFCRRMNNYLKVAEVSIPKLVKIEEPQQVQFHLVGPDSGHRMVPVATSRQVAIDEYRSAVFGSGNDTKARQY